MDSSEQTPDVARTASWKATQSDYVQAVFSHYLVDKGVVFADQEEWARTGEVRQYYPLTRPSLPFELAKIPDGDVDAAVRFVQEWGVLSSTQYGKQISALSVSMAADPLWFIWGHAYCIRLLLRLWKAVNTGQPEVIMETVKADDGDDWDNLVKVDGEDSALPVWYREQFRANQRGFKGPEKEEVRHRYWPNSKELTLETAETEAMHTIVSTISGNFWFMRTYLTINEPTQLWSRHSAIEFGYDFDSLYQIAYWHLAQLFTQSQAIGRCKECGELFSQTDRRQQFCPPSELEVTAAGQRGSRVQSKCGLRYRTRQSRNRKDGTE